MQLGNLLQLLNEQRNLLRDDAPNHSFINAIIGVCQQISKPDDCRLLSNGLKILAMTSLYAIQGFANDLKLAFNGRGQHFIAAVVIKTPALGKLSNGPGSRERIVNLTMLWHWPYICLHTDQLVARSQVKRATT